MLAIRNRLSSLLFAPHVADDDKTYAYPAIVKHQIERDVASSYDAAAAYIAASDCRAVNIQHEYGLFGGLWGSYVARSATTIVLARPAIDILIREHGVNPAKLRFIPHGVPNVQRIPDAKAWRVARSWRPAGS